MFLVADVDTDYRKAIHSLKRLCGVTLNDDEKAFLGGIFAKR